MKSFKYLLILSCICIAFTGTAQAESQEAIIDSDILMVPMAEGKDEIHHKFMFISAEAEHGGKVIKGAPYSAQTVTERTQTLADGNRIVEKSTAGVYRDREGRTRREMQLNAIGPWEASEDAPSRIFIHDPVGKVHYVLEPENQIARKMKVEAETFEKKPGKGEKFEHRMIGHSQAEVITTKKVIRYKTSPKDAKTESLGKQMMEGILAEGTRSTITIPAGQMGNEMPIQIVTERWYSPELQVNIMTRHSDPRLGETVYQLTNIRRGEQERSLFEVPKGYKIEDAPEHRTVIHREKR